MNPYTATLGQAVVPMETGLEKYGPLGIMALLFLTAVIVLWRWAHDRQKSFDTERAAWSKERDDLRSGFDKLRIEFADKHAELADGYANDLRIERDKARDHEDEVRREFTELMEGISARQLEGSQAIAGVLEKFRVRFVAPGARAPKRG
jgi:cell division protein FtsL